MLTFLLDENVPRKVLDAIHRHNARSPAYPLDAIAVGGNDAPTYGTRDPELLKWIEDEGRILVTRDILSMPQHLADHLATGGHLPGILEIRLGTTIPELLEALQLIAHAGTTEDFADRIVFVP
jgi:predicted nuclease of predicted toxin-antitoxin system